MLNFYRYLFKRAANLAAGFNLFVRLVLRACRMAVRARVLFICADFAISGAAAHCMGSETTRPFLGPAVQRHFMETRPVPGRRLNTFLCSVMNSYALIRCTILLLLDNDRRRILYNDRSFRPSIRAHNVLDAYNDYTLVFCNQFRSKHRQRCV